MVLTELHGQRLLKDQYASGKWGQAGVLSSTHIHNNINIASISFHNKTVQGGLQYRDLWSYVNTEPTQYAMYVYKFRIVTEKHYLPLQRYIAFIVSKTVAYFSNLLEIIWHMKLKLLNTSCDQLNPINLYTWSKLSLAQILSSWIIYPFRLPTVFSMQTYSMKWAYICTGVHMTLFTVVCVINSSIHITWLWCSVKYV